jgi:hypothetical protein
MLAPLCRAAAHVGYLVAKAELATDDNWAAQAEDIKQELEDVAAHMVQGTSSNHQVFVGPVAIAAYAGVKQNIHDLISEAPATKAEAMRVFATLNSNIAYTAAAYERALTGEEVDEGSAP